MANNRMWLKNTRTGARVMLAKYSPSAGWYTVNDSLHETLDKAFDTDPEPPTQWGSNEWTLEYEQEAEQSTSDNVPPKPQ